jgi:lipopolysaccharide transport system ATP-binding protein
MSSGEVAISIRGLSKSFQIEHGRPKATTFRDLVMDRLRHPFRRAQSEIFWAVRDVDLDIIQGDVVGIIGRNGAGKSTLLKLLSRISEPTTGVIDLYGRVGSLLEVGTGFHPELTGRENIYLNGAILGMRRSEIRRQFDAIVDFAEVEKFLDTPVKRYSSGMYVRLAFAVAAHLDPEILIVDEVLAVGDAQFQNKCLGKMGEVARSGRTVILVSHNMAAISNLCNRVVVMDGGRVNFAGETALAVQAYMSLGKTTRGDAASLARCRPAWAKPMIQSVRTIDESGNDCGQYLLGSDVLLEVAFDVGALPPLTTPNLGIVVNHPTLGIIGGVNMRMTGYKAERPSYQNGVIRCRIKQTPLLQGEYSVDIWLGDAHVDYDMLAAVSTFEIEVADVYKTGSAPYRGLGTVFLNADWEVSGGLDTDPNPSRSQARTPVLAAESLPEN